MNAILVISNALDVHTDVVARRLGEVGENVIRLNTDCFATDEVQITVDDDNEHNSGVAIAGKFIEFSNIKSVWYRRPGPVQVRVKHPGQRKFAEKELREFLFQLYYATMPQACWVSRFEALESARRKVLQLRVAKQFGFTVPRTCVTNSPSRVREFYEACKGRMAYKTLYQPVIQLEEGGEMWGVPTTIITKQQLELIDLIASTGGIFQEYVEKAYELRVTVIGKHVSAAKIDSQLENTARIDWREAVNLGKVSVSPYQLPVELEDRCRALVCAFGLNFGGNRFNLYSGR